VRTKGACIVSSACEKPSCMEAMWEGAKQGGTGRVGGEGPGALARLDDDDDDKRGGESARCGPGRRVSTRVGRARDRRAALARSLAPYLARLPARLCANLSPLGVLLSPETAERTSAERWARVVVGEGSRADRAKRPGEGGRTDGRTPERPSAWSRARGGGGGRRRVRRPPSFPTLRPQASTVEALSFADP